MPHKKGLWEIEARGLFSDFYSNLQKIIRRQGDQKVNKGIKQKIYICLNIFFRFFLLITSSPSKVILWFKHSVESVLNTVVYIIVSYWFFAETLFVLVV